MKNVPLVGTTVLSVLFYAGITALVSHSVAAADAKKRTKAKAVTKTVSTTIKLAEVSKATPAKAVKKLERTVKKVKGVTKAKLNKKTGELVVRHAKSTTDAAIKAAIAKAGFELHFEKADVAEDEEFGPIDDDDNEPDEAGLTND